MEVKVPDEVFIQQTKETRECRHQFYSVMTKLQEQSTKVFNDVIHDSGILPYKDLAPFKAPVAKKEVHPKISKKQDEVESRINQCAKYNDETLDIHYLKIDDKGIQKVAEFIKVTSVVIVLQAYSCGLED